MRARGQSHPDSRVRLQPDFCDGPPKGGHYRLETNLPAREMLS
jgi:hypothetical protein